MFRFPDNLFTEVRIEKSYSAVYNLQNEEVVYDSSVSTNGARIRVYDGEMWYTSTTTDLDKIQDEIDNLAEIANPNDKIYEDPMIKNFGDSKAEILVFNGENDNRRITRDTYIKLVKGYVESCIDPSIEEIKVVHTSVGLSHLEKEYYSSKGAEIKQDIQNCGLSMWYEIVVDGITTVAGKSYSENAFEKLFGKEAEILAERDRYMEYAKKAVDVVPGDYTCVLAPVVTAMFTHESFGHKSEADFMLNDKTLREEWVMGKKVGNEKVSICDRGDLLNHGYAPYDDEGNKASVTWLIKEGVLTGRLHDSNSAAVLGEAVTGSARAQDYNFSPLVRMTNTYMEKGNDDPEAMIAGVENGIYVYGVNYGTGNSTFTMQPNLCYYIRDGKLCEPVRANVITGTVFQTLFDIDAVGTDFVLFDTFNCGKGGQGMPVSAGGPTIRVKKLSVS